MYLLLVKRRLIAMTGARLFGGASMPENGLFADQETSELVSLPSLSQLSLPIIVFIIFFLSNYPIALFLEAGNVLASIHSININGIPTMCQELF